MKYQQPDLTDEACEILSRTNDGSDLAREHLALVQAAVNKQLTNRGVHLLRVLHQQVTTDAYHRPYLFGVPHLTKNVDGYVLWREEHVVEHFSEPRSQAAIERLRVAAIELAQRCLSLEARNIVPNISTVLNDVLCNRRTPETV
jgi:hypothetical protein